MDLQVSLISAPKLEALGPLCDRDNHSRLALGYTIIQVDLYFVILSCMMLLYAEKL